MPSKSVAKVCDDRKPMFSNAWVDHQFSAWSTDWSERTPSVELTVRPSSFSCARGTDFNTRPNRSASLPVILSPVSNIRFAFSTPNLQRVDRWVENHRSTLPVGSTWRSWDSPKLWQACNRSVLHQPSEWYRRPRRYRSRRLTHGHGLCKGSVWANGRATWSIPCFVSWTCNLSTDPTAFLAPLEDYSVERNRIDRNRHRTQNQHRRERAHEQLDRRSLCSHNRIILLASYHRSHSSHRVDSTSRRRCDSSLHTEWSTEMNVDGPGFSAEAEDAKFGPAMIRPFDSWFVLCVDEAHTDKVSCRVNHRHTFGWIDINRKERKTTISRHLYRRVISRLSFEILFWSMHKVTINIIRTLRSFRIDSFRYFQNLSARSFLTRSHRTFSWPVWRPST